MDKVTKVGWDLYEVVTAVAFKTISKASFFKKHQVLVKVQSPRFSRL